VKIAEKKEKARLKAVSFAASDAWLLVQGIFNGAANVFPNASLPDLCRKNVTSAYSTINNFIAWSYTFPAQTNNMLTDIGNALAYPYGLSYSCFFAAYTVFLPAPPSNSSSIANRVIIVNNYLTNFVFNLGYLYGDISNYILMPTSTTWYWKITGQYIGDFIMRFFYRTNFSSTY